MLDLAGLLPTPPCGGAGTVTGTTPIGGFNGDAISVQAYYGTDTTIDVSVADSLTGTGITWQTSWTAADGGALPPRDSATVAVFATRDRTSSWEVPGTVNVTAATDPTAASDAGQGGRVEETVAFAPSGFNLSGTLSSPYCTIAAATTTSP